MHGIDLSKHNTEYNISRFLEKRCTSNTKPAFAILKATEGRTYSDPKFFTNFNICKEFGISLFGAYHYARPDNGNTPMSEMNNFLNVIGEYDMRVSEWMPVIDWEGESIGHESWLYEFCIHFQNETKKPIVIYTNLYGVSKIQNFIKHHPNAKEILLNCGLWLATRGRKYNDIPKTPWNVVAMHQYDISTDYNIDMNYFFGNDEQFSKYCITASRNDEITEPCHCGCKYCCD